jgi:hypothetical protein
VVSGGGSLYYKSRHSNLFLDGNTGRRPLFTKDAEFSSPSAADRARFRRGAMPCHGHGKWGGASANNA